MQDLSNLTKEQIQAHIEELEEKYKKLYKLANKLAEEMDNLSADYQASIKELNTRKNAR